MRAQKPRFYYVRQSAVITDTLNKSLFWREEKICDELSDTYNVEILCSSFDHYTKKDREPLQYEKAYAVKIFPTPGYKTHTGLARIFDALAFAVKASAYLVLDTSRGDTVVFAIPTPAPILISRILRIKGVTVVYDLRDAWPDAIIDTKSILYPMFYFYMKVVFLIAGVKNSFCLSMSDTLAKHYSDKFGLHLAKLKTLIFRRGIYHPDSADSESRLYPVRDRRLRERKYIFFAGSIVDQFDWDIFFDFVITVPNEYDVVVAGDGPLLNMLIKRGKDVQNLRFLGRISPEEVRLLSIQSFFNFCFYAGEEFKGHITNKVLEYAESIRPMVHNLGTFFVNGIQIKLGVEVNRKVEFCKVKLKIDETKWDVEREAFFHVCSNASIQDILNDTV